MTGIIKVDDLKDAGGNSIISSNGSGTFTYTFNAGSIARAALAADIIDGTKLADNAVDSEHYADGSIDLAHMSVNSIDSDQYVDGSIDTAHIADDQVTLAKMAGLARGKIIYGDSSGNPAALTVGSNGQVLKSDGTDISWGTDAGFDVTSITGATALGATPADTDEFILSDAGVLKRVDYSHIKGGENSPYFLAYNVNSTTISNSTNTTMPFGNEVYDPDSTYDTSTYRWTPGVAGRYYLFSMCVMNAANIGSSHQQNYTMYNKAGTTIANSIWVGGSGSTIRPVNQISVLYDLTDTTDYFYVTIYHNSGNTNQTYTGRPTQYFGGFRLI